MDLSQMIFVITEPMDLVVNILLVLGGKEGASIQAGSKAYRLPPPMDLSGPAITSLKRDGG